MAQQARGSRIGYLAMTFVVVGLAGIFATYAVPIPLVRALRRDSALDAALATAQAPDPAKALAALRPRLGGSAAAVISGPSPLPVRVAAERTRMRAQFLAEANAEAGRMRLLIGVITVMGALFGAAMVGFGRK